MTDAFLMFSRTSDFGGTSVALARRTARPKIANTFENMHGIIRLCKATRETAIDWSTVHAAAVYPSHTRHERTTALNGAGFKNVRWLFSGREWLSTNSSSLQSVDGECRRLFDYALPRG
jgi:hypothetical protein